MHILLPIQCCSRSTKQPQLEQFDSKKQEKELSKEKVKLLKVNRLRKKHQKLLKKKMMVLMKKLENKKMKLNCNLSMQLGKLKL